MLSAQWRYSWLAFLGQAVFSSIVAIVTFNLYIFFTTHGREVGAGGLFIGLVAFVVAIGFGIVAYAPGYIFLAQYAESANKARTTIPHPGRTFLILLIPSMLLSIILFLSFIKLTNVLFGLS